MILQELRETLRYFDTLRALLNDETICSMIPYIKVVCVLTYPLVKLQEKLQTKEPKHED